MELDSLTKSSPLPPGEGKNRTEDPTNFKFLSKVAARGNSISYPAKSGRHRLENFYLGTSGAIDAGARREKKTRHARIGQTIDENRYPPTESSRRSRFFAKEIAFRVRTHARDLGRFRGESLVSHNLV